VKAATPNPTWAKAGATASYGSTSQPKSRVVLAPNQNTENNPMQSSLAVAGHPRSRENILTRRANHLQYSIIAPLQDAHAPARRRAVWRDRRQTSSTTLEVAPARHGESIASGVAEPRAKIRVPEEITT
jgi:hypothetical protein